MRERGYDRPVPLGVSIHGEERLSHGGGTVSGIPTGTGGLRASARDVANTGYRGGQVVAVFPSPQGRQPISGRAGSSPGPAAPGDLPHPIARSTSGKRIRSALDNDPDGRQPGGCPFCPGSRRGNPSSIGARRDPRLPECAVWGHDRDPIFGYDGGPGGGGSGLRVVRHQ